MDSQAEKLNKDLVAADQTVEMERGLNPSCWTWAEVEVFLQRNEPWSWIAIPCKGMTGFEIVHLEPAKVRELCASLEPEKLEAFVDLVNYLRVLHCGVSIRNENGGVAVAANSSA